jgi:hypothetical protein
VVDDGVVVLDRRVLLIALLVIFTAKEAVVSKGKLVAGHQLLFASHTPEAFQVKDFILSSHHKVVFTEGSATLVAFGSKQPAMKHLNSEQDNTFLKEVALK